MRRLALGCGALLACGQPATSGDTSALETGGHGSELSSGGGTVESSDGSGGP